jgi:hypothetical protein
MKRWPIAILLLLGIAAIALPYRFGMFSLLAPALVLGALALTGVVRDYDEDGEEEGARDSLFSEHGVKLLVVAGTLCMVGIIGGMRSCNASNDRASLRNYAGQKDDSKDFIRQRAQPRQLPFGPQVEGKPMGPTPTPADQPARAVPTPGQGRSASSEGP